MSRRILELEERERALHTALDDMRACIVDAVEDLIPVVGPRHASALQALERLLGVAGATGDVDLP